MSRREQWVPIPGWEAEYSVNRRGQIRSEPRVSMRSDRKPYRVGGGILKLFRKGRWVGIRLYRPGQAEWVNVNKLVTEVFGRQHASRR